MDSRLSTRRGAAFEGVLGAAIVAALVITPATLLAQTGSSLGSNSLDEPVPRGFIARQNGSAVWLRDVVTSAAAHCGVTTIENTGAVGVTGVRIVATALAGGPAGSTLSSALHATSPMLEVALPPGARATVDPHLVSLDELRLAMRSSSPHVMCAIAELRYADGTSWTSAGTAMAPTSAEIDRAWMRRAAGSGAPTCRTQDGNEFSTDAVVPVVGEGNSFARCAAGAWADYRLPPSAAR